MSDLETLMHETKRAAERRIRDEFQRRWGSFWKCRDCGGVRTGAMVGRPDFSCKCPLNARQWGAAYRTGYSPPPTDAR